MERALLLPNTTNNFSFEARGPTAEENTHSFNSYLPCVSTFSLHVPRRKSPESSKNLRIKKSAMDEASQPEAILYLPASNQNSISNNFEYKQDIQAFEL